MIFKILNWSLRCYLCRLKIRLNNFNNLIFVKLGLILGAHNCDSQWLRYKANIAKIVWIFKYRYSIKLKKILNYLKKTNF